MYGGYGRPEPNKNGSLLNDVELVSTKPGNLCTKFIRPVFGRTFYIDGTVYNAAQTIGAVGAYTRDAAIVCGGKNVIDNQADCYEFNSTANRWYPIPSMTYKRYQATSVLDKHGDMWVFGGSIGYQNTYETEVYRYQPPPKHGQWSLGRSLPPGLSKTGIKSHCAVQINRTHVMIAGGYAGPDEKNRIPPDMKEWVAKNPSVKDFAGTHLNKTWLYNGQDWVETADMSTPRDRAACSLVELPNGETRILVAGGCKGWCVDHYAMSSAEMYDPGTNTWTRVADLPQPLNGASMDLLDGLPTIIGGYDDTNWIRNDKLYQYHVNANEWKAIPDVKLRIARTSAVTFQIPYELFKFC